MVDAYRGEHGLGPSQTPYTLRITQENRPFAAAWSRHIVPMPADYGTGAIQTGTIVTPTALRDRMGTAGPDETLLSWIGKGSAPIWTPPKTAVRAVVQQRRRWFGGQPGFRRGRSAA